MRPARLWDEIDLHLVAMLMLCVPVICLSWWWLAAPLVLPQGRIFVRAFEDYPAFGQRPWAYLVANEVMVFVAVGAFAGSRFAAGLMAGAR